MQGHKTDVAAQRPADVGSNLRVRRAALPGGVRVYVCDHQGGLGFRLGAVQRRLEIGVRLSGSWRQVGRGRRPSDSQCFHVDAGEVYDVKYGDDGPGRTVLFAWDPGAWVRLPDLSRFSTLLSDAARAVARHMDEQTPLPDGLDDLCRDVVRTGDLWPSTPLYRARAELLDSFDRPLYMKHLAATARVQTETFIRRFAATMGTSPARYRAQIRLDEAAELAWLRPELRLAEVAATCGFEHVGYFRRAFKRAFGVTPSAHRDG